jgi:hypothetical protein
MCAVHGIRTRKPALTGDCCGGKKIEKPPLGRDRRNKLPYGC